MYPTLIFGCFLVWKNSVWDLSLPQTPSSVKFGFGLALALLVASCQSATPQSSELQKQEHKLWINANLIRRNQADLPELVRTEEADKLARDASCMFLDGKWDKSDSDRKVALGADVSAENYSQDYENTADKAIANSIIKRTNL
jgi:hypothetical protein